MQISEKENKENSLLISSSSIDVQNIIKEIKERIDKRKRDGIYLEGDDVAQLEEIELKLKETGESGQKLLRLNTFATIDLEGDPIVSHRKIAGPIIKLFKKISRVVIRKYTDSIFCKQSNFNSEIISYLTDMSLKLNQIEKELNKLKQLINNNEKK